MEVEVHIDFLKACVWADYECDPRFFQRLLHDATNKITTMDGYVVPASFELKVVNQFLFCMYETGKNGKLNLGIYMPVEIAKVLLTQ